MDLDNHGAAGHVRLLLESLRQQTRSFLRRSVQLADFYATIRRAISSSQQMIPC